MSAIERTLYRLGKKDILGKGITILTKELNKYEIRAKTTKVIGLYKNL